MHRALSEHPFCAHLTSAQVESLARVAEPRTYPEHELLIRADSEADQLLLIRQGRVALELQGRILQTLGPGDILGVSWLAPPYRWKWDAVALDATRAIAVQAAALRAMMGQDPSLAASVYRAMTEALMQRLDASRLQLLDLYRSPR